MSITPRAPYGSLLKGNPLGIKTGAAAKDAPKAKPAKRGKKAKRK